MTGMILDPLAEVGIGMLVAVMIGGGQFVMDLQRGGERRHRQQESHQKQGDGRTESHGGVTGQHSHLIV